MSARNRRHRHKAGASQDSYESNENGNGNEHEHDGMAGGEADELFGEHRSRRRSAAHKDEQLCEQVFQILMVAMADLADEVLSALSLESVQMGPDSARLLVTMVAPAGREAGAMDTGDVMARLTAARGALRSEIAAGIHRKRTPELSFRVMTREEVER
jgi:ribosome-binding factor A